jgi:hypothetical protein
MCQWYLSTKVSAAKSLKRFYPLAYHEIIESRQPPFGGVYQVYYATNFAIRNMLCAKWRAGRKAALNCKIRGEAKIRPQLITEFAAHLK